MTTGFGVAELVHWPTSSIVIIGAVLFAGFAVALAIGLRREDERSDGTSAGGTCDETPGAGTGCRGTHV